MNYDQMTARQLRKHARENRYGITFLHRHTKGDLIKLLREEDKREGNKHEVVEQPVRYWGALA